MAKWVAGPIKRSAGALIGFPRGWKRGALQNKAPYSGAGDESIGCDARSSSLQRRVAVAVRHHFLSPLEPFQSATVTHKKVAGMDVASLRGLWFWRLNSSSSSFCKSAARSAIASPIQSSLGIDFSSGGWHNRLYKSEYLGLRHGTTSESFACKRASEDFADHSSDVVTSSLN